MRTSFENEKLTENVWRKSIEKTMKAKEET